MFKKKYRKEGRERRREGGRKEEDNGPHTGEVYYKYRVIKFSSPHVSNTVLMNFSWEKQQEKPKNTHKNKNKIPQRNPKLTKIEYF